MIKLPSRIIFLLIAVCTAATLFWMRNSYVPYIPQVRQFNADHTIIYDPSLLTSEHVEKLSKLMDMADRAYKIVDGELMIKRSLARDKDLLANYTSKAMDL